jgi:hypothetical protein
MMAAQFPGAELWIEKVAGLSKSVMVIGRSAA